MTSSAAAGPKTLTVAKAGPGTGLWVTLRPVFGARMRDAVALLAPVPVEAQGCGVVAELAADGVEDGVSECWMASRGWR